MMKSNRLLIIACLAAAGAVAGLVVMKQTLAANDDANKPAPCVCSALQKLEYTPVSPTEPLSRMYIGHCQCGKMDCVITNGALQCTK